MTTGEVIALIKALSGGGGLPPVTESDAGKVLSVNDSGVWGAQEPIGKKFIVTLTPTAQDFSGTMDKTVAEINAAYEAGQEIWFRFDDGNGGIGDIPLMAANSLPSYTYPSFNTQIINEDAGILIFVFTRMTDNGTKQTYSTKFYPLTPAT